MIPDDSRGDCVTMTTKPIAGFWTNVNCGDSYPFICESPRNGISPPTHAPTPPPIAGCANGWSGKPHFRQCYRVRDKVIPQCMLGGIKWTLNNIVQL